jgi:hypothetical protein
METIEKTSAKPKWDIRRLMFMNAPQEKAGRSTEL